MKLTHTPSIKRKSGMTLLELTVVILVLLSLISILFVGARAWKKGSDRSANIMNVRNVQQAVRGHQNTRGHLATVTVVQAEIFGDDGYMKIPKPPIAEVEYQYETTYGAPGVLFVSNPDIGGDATTGEYFFSTQERIDGKVSDW